MSSNQHSVSVSRFAKGTTKVETRKLTVNVDPSNDRETLTITINDTEVALDAYQANDLLAFLSQQQGPVEQLARAKNERAIEEDAKDIAQIDREWRAYRNEGLGERG